MVFEADKLLTVIYLVMCERRYLKYRNLPKLPAYTTLSSIIFFIATENKLF